MTGKPPFRTARLPQRSQQQAGRAVAARPHRAPTQGSPEAHTYPRV